MVALLYGRIEGVHIDMDNRRRAWDHGKSVACLTEVFSDEHLTRFLHELHMSRCFCDNDRGMGQSTNKHDYIKWRQPAHSCSLVTPCSAAWLVGCERRV